MKIELKNRGGYLLVNGVLFVRFPWSWHGSEAWPTDPEAEIRADLEAYAAGENLKAIARRRGCSHETIVRLVNAAGLPRRHAGGQQASHRARYGARGEA